MPTTTFTGVTWNVELGRYQVVVTAGAVEISLGSFNAATEAARMADAALFLLGLPRNFPGEMRSKAALTMVRVSLSAVGRKAKRTRTFAQS